MAAGGRAFTLVEILIVLAIALALGAVSLRSAMSWSDRDRLASAVSGLSSAALEARSHALMRSAPVGLVAARREPGAVRIGMVFEAEGNEDAGEGALLDSVESEGRAMRVLYELPEGFGIADGDAPAESAGDGGQRTRLLRAMPDGSVVLAGLGWSLTHGQAVYLPAIEPWTARISFDEADGETETEDFSPAGTGADGP